MSIQVDNRPLLERIKRQAHKRIEQARRLGLRVAPITPNGFKAEVHGLLGEVTGNKVYTGQYETCFADFDGDNSTPDLVLPDGREVEIKMPTKRHYALCLHYNWTRDRVLQKGKDAYLLTWPTEEEGVVDIMGWATQQEMADAPLVNWNIGDQLSLELEKLRLPRTLSPLVLNRVYAEA